MAEVEGGDVSRHAFQVAYHGTDADDHSMDVEALAPALMAFGRLIRESNLEINKDRAKVKVLVTSDFEHKCFNINFDVIQTTMQLIKSFLADENVETATELLKTIGVVGTAAGAGGSLFGYLRWKGGRKVKQIQKLTDKDSSGDVIFNINIGGDGNSINIPVKILKLSENKKVLQTINDTLGPIETKDAERIEFRQADKPTASYNREDVKAIVASCEAGPDAVLVDETKPTPEIVTATLHSYGPVFDNKAKTWRFKHNKKPIYADISETAIAKDGMRRGGSFVNDRYRVRMEVTPPESEDGTPHYKIKEVLDFTEAPQQAMLPLRAPKRKAKKRR